MINLGLLRNNYEFKKIDWEFILRFLSKYDLNVYFKKDYESKKNRKGTLGLDLSKKKPLGLDPLRLPNSTKIGWLELLSVLCRILQIYFAKPYLTIQSHVIVILNWPISREQFFFNFQNVILSYPLVNQNYQ